MHDRLSGPGAWVTGEVKTAERIALSLRRAALGAHSDYMRRTAAFRVRLGSRMASPEEMQAHEEAVLRIADELDALADNPTAKIDAFENVANKLRMMGAFPDPEFYSTVVWSFPREAATWGRNRNVSCRTYKVAKRTLPSACA